MDQKILGLDVSSPFDENEVVSPYAAIAIVKAMDSDGDWVYAVVMSECLNVFDASSMLRYATIYMDKKLEECLP